MSKLDQVINSFNKAKAKVIEELDKNVLLAGIHLEGVVKDNTPVSVDWWTLQNSINTGETKHVGTKITVEIGTNLDYAAHVEYWVTAKTKTWKVRKNPYDYHKWTRVFKTGTGASMFRSAVDTEQENIKDIIKNWW